MKPSKILLGTGAALAALSSQAFAETTATGDKLDGLVELQDLGISMLGGAGGMAIVVLSVIIAVVMFTVTQRFTALVVPLVVGLFLTIGFNTAKSFGGVSAQVDDFAPVLTQAEHPLNQQS